MPSPQKAWNSAEAVDVLNEAPLWYCNEPDPHSRVVAVRGNDTAFDDSLARQAGRRMEGPSESDDAILLVEIMEDVMYWSEPGDLIIDDSYRMPGRNDVTIDLFAHEPKNYYVCFRDGMVWRLSKNTPLERVRPFLTVTGAATHDRDHELGPYRMTSIWQEFLPDNLASDVH